MNNKVTSALNMLRSFDLTPEEYAEITKQYERSKTEYFVSVMGANGIAESIISRAPNHGVDAVIRAVKHILTQDQEVPPEKADKILFLDEEWVLKFYGAFYAKKFAEILNEKFASHCDRVGVRLPAGFQPFYSYAVRS